MHTEVPEKTRGHLEWSRVCDRLAHHTRGPVAYAAALKWALAEDEETLNLRRARVDEARRWLDLGRSVPLGEVQDVRADAGLAARGGVLEGESLAAIGVVLETSARCRRVLDDLGQRAASEVAEPSALVELGRGLPLRLDLARELVSAFNERGELNDSASGDLGHLRLRVTQLHGQLKHRIDALVSDPVVGEMLQDEYYTIREDRYVLPVRSGHKNHLPGIVHGWSKTGQTVYIEPQAVVEANNALRFAQADVEREITRILTRLSARVGEAAADIQDAVERLAQLDLALAAGQLSGEMAASSADLSTNGVLLLRSARHPLLVLEGIEVISNDLELGGAQRALVITGPNTGGKTVALKTVGLCVLMALSGLHVPCGPGSIVPIVPGIYSDIGDDQSLSEHLSTFSGHVKNLISILGSIGHGALVLLDEIVIGTDPTQGAALAQALLESIADRGALAVVTTHYEALKALPFADARFRNGAMGVEPTSRAPSYRLRLDVPGTSSALQTARRLGLPPEIVDRATELCGQQQRQLDIVLSKLEADAEGARLARVAAEEDRRETLKARELAVAHEHEWRERTRNALSRERNAALEDARRLRDEVRSLRAELNSGEVRRDPRQLEEKQAKVQAVITRLIEQNELATQANAGPAVPVAQLVVGKRVYVMSLSAEGEIVKGVDDRGRCEVRLGMMTSRIEVSDLRHAGERSGEKVAVGRNKPPSKPAPSSNGATLVAWSDAPPQSPQNTLDLRGMRSDEAKAASERFLDAHLEKESAVVYLIHGHGTGALKKELRAWLRTCPYARDARPAESNQGGDGVTAVLLS
ncbi:MAG: hypothetical protein EXR76_19545 [Myxococcales bacterium]|nr:hypothetical protein [Myxococcales bacterium]